MSAIVPWTEPGGTPCCCTTVDCDLLTDESDGYPLVEISQQAFVSLYAGGTFTSVFSEQVNISTETISGASVTMQGEVVGGLQATSASNFCNLLFDSEWTISFTPISSTLNCNVTPPNIPGYILFRSGCFFQSQSTNGATGLIRFALTNNPTILGRPAFLLKARMQLTLQKGIWYTWLSASPTQPVIDLQMRTDTTIVTRVASLSSNPTTLKLIVNGEEILIPADLTFQQTPTSPVQSGSIDQPVVINFTSNAP